MEGNPRVSPIVGILLAAVAVLGLAACDGSMATNMPAPAPITTAPIPRTTPGQPATGSGPATPLARPGSPGTNPPAQIPACPADVSAPLFNTLPVDASDFLAFRPLGFLSPPIHIFPAKHSAFSMTLPGQQPVARPVRAPGRVWVVEIWEASFSTGGANYQVFVYPCREVRVYFGHVASLSERLTAEFNKGEPKCNSFPDGTATVTTCRRDGMAVLLEAGEQFGMGPDTAGVDLGVVDFRRKPAGFANLEHYDYFYPYYASPLDYFTPETRRVLEGKTGHMFGSRMRTAEPIGGTYMQDIPGTAQGNWFFPGKYHRNSTDLSPSLGLVHDYVDPTQPVMAIGSSVPGVRMGLYSFRVERDGLVNRDFGAVTADGKTFCYDRFLQGQSAGGLPLGRPDGMLLLSMPSEATLKIELLAGSSCQAVANWAFTVKATVFER